MNKQVNLSHVVLVESQVNPEMQAFLERRSPAMLPVAGKPLIHLWCEFLANMGTRKLDIALRSFPEQVRRYVGNGEPWGLEINLVSLTPEADLDNVIDKVAVEQLEKLLLPLEQLPMGEFVDKQPENTADNQFLLSGKALTKGHWVAAQSIHSPKDLWQVNMDLISNVAIDPLPAGQEIENGLYVDTGVQIKPGFSFEAPCRIGKHCLIEASVNLDNSVIIGQNAIIDKQTYVSESLIFDDTYVGSQSDLKRVIVDGSLVYSVDNDTAVWVDDPLIVSSIRKQVDRVTILEKLTAGLLLGLFMLPMVMIYIARHLQKKPAVIEETFYLPVGRKLNGTARNKALQTISLNINHNGWRRIPWLLNVIKGDLKLLGPSLQSSDDSPLPDWAVEIIDHKPGMITLADCENQEETNRYVSDVFHFQFYRRKCTFF